MGKLSWSGVAVLAIGAAIMIAGGFLNNDGMVQHGSEVLGGGAVLLGVGQVTKKKVDKQ